MREVTGRKMRECLVGQKEASALTLNGKGQHRGSRAATRAGLHIIWLVPAAAWKGHRQEQGPTGRLLSRWWLVGPRRGRRGDKGGHVPDMKAELTDSADSQMGSVCRWGAKANTKASWANTTWCLPLTEAEVDRLQGNWRGQDQRELSSQHGKRRGIRVGSGGSGQKGAGW